MARSVGVRELRAKVSCILRRVREKRESVDVTYRGRLIARIVPVAPPATAAEAPGAVWTNMDRLAREIGEHWEAGGESAAQVVSEGRR